MRCIALFTALLATTAFAQTAQVGADREARGTDRVIVEHLHYRPAVWETAAVKEYESDHPNEGGLVYAYIRNVSDEPINLRFWRVNGQDESYWRLNHFIAWDRIYDEHLDPGERTVLEINGVTDDFRHGNEFKLHYVESSWRPCLRYETTLTADPVRIGFIRVHPDMKTLDVHMRHAGEGTETVTGVEVMDHEVVNAELWGAELSGPDNAVARLTLAEPLAPGTVTVVRTNLKSGGQERSVYAHRRAHADYFPIGIWHSDPERYDLLKSLHIDTMVAGGNPDEMFYQVGAPEYGFRNMVHSGVPTDPDRVRGVKDKPSLACWMIQDEPDWSIPANIMLHEDKNLRRYDVTKPTFITLCRNTQFFAYGPIADIPCQDHYSVTAPSSSLWPTPYGTRLEETAYYTRDLKEAAEPKPIWIWSQAIADWGQRPKRPVPTPEELAAQLILNIGRGAKGILWFNYDQGMAERYPDTLEAMGGWGRVMRVMRKDLLASDISRAGVSAPRKVDVAPLVTPDKLILCITNTDYEIDPEAYPFDEKTDQGLRVTLPDWIDPATALRVGPDGIHPLTVERDGADLLVRYGDLKDVAVVVLANSPETEAAYQAEFDAALADEAQYAPK
jgi:hypothetical protein